MMEQEVQAQEPQMQAEPQEAPVQMQEPQQQAQEPQGPRMINVQADQFKDFPGGYHEAVAAGRSWQQLQQEGGMESIAQNRRLLTAYQAQDGNENKTAKEMEEFLMAVETPEPLPDDPSQQPLTQAGLEKMLAAREAKQNEQYQQETERQGRERESQTMGQKLDEMGIKKDDPNYGMYQSMLDQQITAEIRKGFLPIHTEDQMAKMLNDPASADVIGRAAEATQAFLATLGLEGAGKIATQQQQIPGATLGSQPPGRQGTMKLSDVKARASAGDQAAQQMLYDYADNKIGNDVITAD
jgi:ribosome-binding protein aMBF1 (putative translation factor)